jgi:hypothetical protein
LTWSPAANRQSTSRSITSFHLSFSSVVHMQWDGINDGLLSQLSNVDFRYWEPVYVYVVAILCRLVSLFQRCSSSSDDLHLGPFNSSCAYRAVQSGGPQTARIFQYRDGERCCQARKVSSQICKSIDLLSCLALNHY